MLRTRLIVGTLLAAGAAGLLIWDESQGPVYPGLFGLCLGLGLLASRELRDLLRGPDEARDWVVLFGILGVLFSNFPLGSAGPRGWGPVVGTFAGAVLAALVWEMAAYAGPGGVVRRIAGSILAVAYLGILPSFLLRLRWLPEHSGLALALAIAVPKAGDIGAYATGRVVGRTPMAPRLSPKKTWEGFAGGTLFAIAAAVGLGQFAPVFRHGVPEAAAFGVVVGWAGVLGDLAESMVKRDAAVKDASARVPGFGGVLDVIDSVIFAAPVAYLWLARHD